MNNNIAIKRGPCDPTGKISLIDGELAYNTSDNILYIGKKDDNDTITIQPIVSKELYIPLTGTIKNKPVTGPILMNINNDNEEYRIEIGGYWDDTLGENGSWSSYNGNIRAAEGTISANIIQGDIIKSGDCPDNLTLGLGDIGVGAGALKFKRQGTNGIQLKMRDNGNITLSTI